MTSFPRTLVSRIIRAVVRKAARLIEMGIAQMGIRIRMMFGTLALLLSLGVTLQGAAQSDDDDIPEGVTDAASISYVLESGDDPLAPIYGFMIFSFVDDDAASTAMDAVPDEFIGMDETGSELIEIDTDEIDGLDDLGDEARAYRIDFGDEVGGLDFSILSVRDGSNLHVWTSIVLDFSFALEDDAAAADDDAAEPADPLFGATDLVEIAADWFDGDKPDRGDLIDQLPTVDQLPDGYVEGDRAENLDEFEDADEEDASARFDLAA